MHSKQIENNAETNNDLPTLFSNTDNGKSKLQELYSLTQELSNLRSAAEVLDTEIQNQVLYNYQDLMCQTVWLQKLETILKLIQQHVEVLLLGIEKLQSDVAEQLNKISTAVKILKQLFETLDIMRKVLRIFNLLRYMKSIKDKKHIQVDSSEVLKNSKELELLLAHPNLKNIHLLENIKASIQSCDISIGLIKS